MPRLKIIEILKRTTEQERIDFFFGAIVSRSWSMMQLEEVLLRGLGRQLTLKGLLSQLSGINAFGQNVMNMLGSMHGISADVQAKVQQYKALPIHERINKVTEFEVAVLRLDNGLRDNNPITQQYNKDFSLFTSIQSLISIYAAEIYAQYETPDSLRILTGFDDAVQRDSNITSFESVPLLNLFLVLYLAIHDRAKKADFKLLFGICLQLEIKEFAGLNKTREFLEKMHAEVHKAEWNSRKSRTTLMGSGKTPGGIQNIRTALSDVPNEALTNSLVRTMFSNVYGTLVNKVGNKPYKRSEVTNNFYNTTKAQADALKRGEVQAYDSSELQAGGRPANRR